MQRDSYFYLSREPLRSCPSIFKFFTSWRILSKIDDSKVFLLRPPRSSRVVQIFARGRARPPPAFPPRTRLLISQGGGSAFPTTFLTKPISKIARYRPLEIYNTARGILPPIKQAVRNGRWSEGRFVRPSQAAPATSIILGKTFTGCVTTTATTTTTMST